MTSEVNPEDRFFLEDDEPRFILVEDEDIHHEEPDEPPVGREFYDEPAGDD